MRRKNLLAKALPRVFDPLPWLAALREHGKSGSEGSGQRYDPRKTDANRRQVVLGSSS